MDYNLQTDLGSNESMYKTTTTDEEISSTQLLSQEQKNSNDNKPNATVTIPSLIKLLSSVTHLLNNPSLHEIIDQITQHESAINNFCAQLTENCENLVTDINHATEVLNKAKQTLLQKDDKFTSLEELKKQVQLFEQNEPSSDNILLSSDMVTQENLELRKLVNFMSNRLNYNLHSIEMKYYKQIRFVKNMIGNIVQKHNELLSNHKIIGPNVNEELDRLLSTDESLEHSTQFVANMVVNTLKDLQNDSVFNQIKRSPVANPYRYMCKLKFNLTFLHTFVKHNVRKEQRVDATACFVPGLKKSFIIPAIVKLHNEENTLPVEPFAFKIPSFKKLAHIESKSTVKFSFANTDQARFHEMVVMVGSCRSPSPIVLGHDFIPFIRFIDYEKLQLTLGERRNTNLIIDVDETGLTTTIPFEYILDDKKFFCKAARFTEKIENDNQTKKLFEEHYLMQKNNQLEEKVNKPHQSESMKEELESFDDYISSIIPQSQKLYPYDYKCAITFKLSLIRGSGEDERRCDINVTFDPTLKESLFTKFHISGYTTFKPQKHINVPHVHKVRWSGGSFSCNEQCTIKFDFEDKGRSANDKYYKPAVQSMTVWVDESTKTNNVAYLGQDFAPYIKYIHHKRMEIQLGPANFREDETINVNFQYVIGARKLLCQDYGCEEMNDLHIQQNLKRKLKPRINQEVGGKKRNTNSDSSSTLFPSYIENKSTNSSNSWNRINQKQQLPFHPSLTSNIQADHSSILHQEFNIHVSNGYNMRNNIWNDCLQNQSFNSNHVWNTNSIRPPPPPSFGIPYINNSNNLSIQNKINN